MSWTRIRSVVLRHWIVLRRAPHRWFEISVWPILDVMLWGSLGVFVAKSDTTSRAATPYLLAGIVMFWTFTQAQFAISLGVNEETWTRNILNVLTTPLNEAEYIAGLVIFGMLKMVLCMATLTVATVVLFDFDVSELGWGIIPIAALLIINGWALALVAVGLVLRLGQSAEILIWGLNYLLMAVSGVFFPADALPHGIGVVADYLPTTQAFSALRELLDGKPLPWGTLGVSLVGSIIFFGLSLALVVWLLRLFRRRGFVTRYS